jgi:hypothetical protein
VISWRNEKGEELLFTSSKVPTLHVFLQPLINLLHGFKNKRFENCLATRMKKIQIAWRNIFNI